MIRQAGRMSTLQHLEELRRRLLVSLLAVGAGMVASFSWAGRLIEGLKQPAGEALPQLIFLSPAEGMVAYLKVAAAAGFVLAMPVLLYELWAFVRPGLSRRECRYAVHFVLWGSLLFAAGVAFAYQVLLPVSLRFLLSFGSESLRPAITISRYLGFTASFLLATGLVFELPVAVFLLSKIGLLTPQRLLRQWRAAVLAMAVAAGLLTPTPDLIDMLLLLAPLLALYGFSIGVCWLATRRPAVQPWVEKPSS